MSNKKTPAGENRLDDVVAKAQRGRLEREQGYRERALKLYPWICGRCSREFTRENVHELTVHHKNHDHDYNPPDGGNWELLCLFCHDNEHARMLDYERFGDATKKDGSAKEVTHQPLAGLANLLQSKK
ncbi:MAG: YajD family HNH nuclease [Pseudomonadota bacterium]|nr:YajD family HNH nuclease [Pseudomonadota bacterium]